METNWIELSVSCATDQTDEVSEALSELGALSVTLRNDEEKNPVLEPLPGETRLWARVCVTALFEGTTNIDQLQSSLDDHLPATVANSAHVEELADRVWERECLDRLKPIKFGDLWVCPSGQTPPPDDCPAITLDPGLAFGTGTHPTTALCLEWLSTHDLVGKAVIDYGCGSGILALAAACRGAGRIQAVDHDPQALTATTENAKLNGYDDRIVTALPEELDPGTVDLIIANILAGPLQQLAPEFVELVSTGGTVVISGVLAENAKRTGARYLEFFRPLQHATRDGWSCMSFTKS